MLVMHNAVNRKFKYLQYQLARMFLLPEQRLVEQMSIYMYSVSQKKSPPEGS